MVEEDRVRYVGNLTQVEPASLLQSISLSTASGVLKVENGQQSISIYFKKGKLVGACLGNTKGAEAIRRFVSTWRKGSFSFSEHAHEMPGQLDLLDESCAVQESLDKLLIRAFGERLERSKRFERSQRCSACGKSDRPTKRLMCGPDFYVCEDCRGDYNVGCDDAGNLP